MTSRIHLIAAVILLFLLVPSPSRAFMKEGCGGGECIECHSMTRDEASKLLEGAVDNVLNVESATSQLPRCRKPRKPSRKTGLFQTR